MSQRALSKAEERAQVASRRGAEESHIDRMLAVMTSTVSSAARGASKSAGAGWHFR